MRKIDKSQQLSTIYQAWENGLTKHPSYNSSNGEYYIDIVMDALRCQNGLCAYTEVQLCPPQYLTTDNWKDGRYKGVVEGRVYDGQLEHFDERLKWKDKVGYEHKDWLWSNFFVIQSDRNNLKSTKTVDYILKPDSDDYDPFKLLEYSLATHYYIANTDLDEPKRQKITNMIEILGLNFPNVVDKRRQVVERIVKYPLTETMEKQFLTAVEFYKKNQNP